MSKKLYRSRKDKMIAGIAGGLAEYFDIDSSLVRVIFVVTLFMGGGGLLAYIILWIVIPEEPLIFEMPSPDEQKTGSDENQPAGSPDIQNPQKNFADTHREQKEKRNTFAGLLLIFLGMLFLAENFIPHFDFGDFWPLILIAIGAGLLINAKK
ncbi:MAG: PspC domain-containing protein [Ignavibacteriaceae bacterium]